MTAGTRPWPVRLAAAAEADLRDILHWTVGQFGEAQARVYAETLSAALEALTAGPTGLGAKARDDIAKGLFTLHVARRGRRGRHFVVFRIGQYQGPEVIEVLRLLHGAMDLPRHTAFMAWRRHALCSLAQRKDLVEQVARCRDRFA